MKIKILNKNENALYDVDDGAVFTETYNETLDTGTVIISNLTTPLEMEPYDIVAIYKTGSDTIWKYMCIDTYTEVMLSVNPRLYRYEITLFSETKQLEGTVLPNLKISKVWGETRSIYYYINQYMNEYCPKIRVTAATTEISTLDTVQSETVGIILGGGYDYSVTLRSSGTVTEIPDLDNLRVSVTIIVSRTQGGPGITTTDDDCEILSSSIVDGHWELRFRTVIGQLNYVPFVTLYEYIVYGEGYMYRPKFVWNNTNVQYKFRDECPEMQWNTPTLREVLNDLMMVQDCIPVLKNGELDFIDLTVTQEPTNDTLSKINYISKSRSSEDYVSEIQVKLENVTNKLDDVNNVVTKTQWFVLNIPDDESTLTTENILIKTQYPIYNLKSVVVMLPAWFSSRNVDDDSVVWNNNWEALDLMAIPNGSSSFSLIYEYKNWITKNVAYNTSHPPVSFYNWKKYQNWTLYYTRGSNEIKGLSSKSKFVWQTGILWQELVYRFYDLIRPSGYYQGYTGLPSIYTLLFKVEYETLEGCLFRASKNEALEHEKVVIDNQTNSYVDSYSQGFLEYQKANRLGNEQLQINARYLPSETELKIGDTYEDSIIYQVQYQCFRDHTEVNALATKNYVLREYFTGVKSKIRSWKIVDGSEALTRHDLSKYYCEFSYNQYLEKDGLGQLVLKDISTYLSTPASSYSSSPLKCCFVRTTDSSDNNYPHDLVMSNVQGQKSYYYLDLMSRIVGNSLVFTFEFLDNYWAGQSIHTDNDYNGSIPTRGNGENEEMYVKRSDIRSNNGSGGDTALRFDDAALIGGGVPMYQHRYTNEIGEYSEIEFVFATNMKIIPTLYWPTAGVEEYWDDAEIGTLYRVNTDSGNVTDQSQRFLYYICQRPRVYESNFKWSGTHTYDVSEFSVGLTLHKDSQEITNISTQFEFCTDTNNICFGKSWLTRQKAISTSDNDVSSLKAYFYSNSKYDFRRPNDLPTGAATDTEFVDIVVESVDNTSATLYIVYKSAGLATGTESVAVGEAKTLRNGKCLYINDGTNVTGHVLLAMNHIPNDNCTAYRPEESGFWYPAYAIHLNILKSRNKNIYDKYNHYLIKKKL